jgi:drug/metabolite transporter (DMT)-like permease
MPARFCFKQPYFRATFAPPLPHPSQLKVHAALFLVALLYAMSYTLAKDVMPQYLLPKGFILLRILGALTLVVFYHLAFVRERVRSMRDFGYMAICALFGVAANMVLFFEGLSRTSPVDASLIMVTTPILVLLIGFVLKTEKPGWQKIIGVLLGTLGAALLITGAHHEDTRASVAGNLMVMLNAASFALYLVLVKPLMMRYHAMTVMLWTFFFGMLFVAPLGVSDLHHAFWEKLSPWNWTEVVIIVIGITFVAYTLNAWALKYVRSSVVGSYVYLQPLLATIIAVGSGKYELHLLQVLYGLLIFAGVFLVSMRQQTRLKEDTI